MARFSSQLIFCSPDEILRRSVVEMNQQNTITSIFSLDNSIVEASNTLFFDGIISSSCVLLNKDKLDIDELKTHYQYVDLARIEESIKIRPTIKPLLLNLDTDSADNIFPLLRKYAELFSEFSVLEIIAGLVYYPAIENGTCAKLEPQRHTKLWLWQQNDLVNIKITKNSHIKV